MSLPILSVPAYPDVPNVAGVPALLRKAQPVLDAIGYIDHIDNVINRLLESPVDEKWGVFDNETNKAVLAPDSIIAVDYRNASRILDYPVEQGAFESYNKVSNPFESSVTMSKGGTVADRQAFLADVEAIAADLKLYTISTPEANFIDVNLERFDYRREQTNGSHLLIVTLYFREVKADAVVNGNAEVVSDPDLADPQSLGQVSAAPITPTQNAAITGAAKALASVKSITSAAVSAQNTVVNTVNGVISSGSAAFQTALKGIVQQ